MTYEKLDRTQLRKMDEEALSLNLNILIKLAEESLRNDKKRFLGCIRMPSYLTLQLSFELMMIAKEIQCRISYFTKS